MTTEDLARLEALREKVTARHGDGREYLTANRDAAIAFAGEAFNALPALIAEVRRLRAEIERIDKEADVELDVQVACDTTVYATVKRVTGRRDYHSVMEAVEDLALECERLREYEPIAVRMERLKLRGPEGV